MKRGLTKSEFEKWAISKGWTKDKYGNFVKTVNGKEYRFKIGSISVRYEVKVRHEGGVYLKPGNEWIRLRSGYFKDLGFASEGKLAGLKL